MADAAYGPLAEVYDWLVSDELLSPAASVAAFAGVDRYLVSARRG